MFARGVPLRDGQDRLNASNAPEELIDRQYEGILHKSCRQSTKVFGEPIIKGRTWALPTFGE